MVRGVIRGKYVPDSETQKIKISVLAAPGTGGRSRQRESNVWNDVEEYEGEVAAFIDEQLPENVPAP